MHNDKGRDLNKQSSFIISKAFIQTFGNHLQALSI